MADLDFDPNGVGIDNGSYFGMPFSVEQSKLVLISAPWDVTTSYGSGTAKAPDAIIEASLQVDLYDPYYPDGWKEGIATDDIDFSIVETSRRMREEAVKVITHLQSGGSEQEEYVTRKLNKINTASEELNRKIYIQSKHLLNLGHIVGLVGGDHSTPLGHIKAVSQTTDSFGLLHIDAHADLRVAYEGFTHSHASIMHNTLANITNIEKLVSVAVRDYCDQEADRCQNDPRIEMFSDRRIQKALMCGNSWDKVCEEIITALPQNVYISFDIDGLTPDNCPNTGTPVPGGITYSQAVYLLEKVADSGKRIIGFDLCEVTPTEQSEWDANVGARILYKLCNVTLKSNK